MLSSLPFGRVQTPFSQRPSKCLGYHHSVMHYFALACDFDQTLANMGVVSKSTLGALERLLASGRNLLLVTGRQLDELQRVFPRISLCDMVVAENGAVLFRPATGETRLLAEAPPQAFIDA